MQIPLIMNPNIRDYFYYPKAQRYSIALLFCLVLLYFFVPKIWSNFQLKKKTDFSQFEKDIVAFEENHKNIPDNYEKAIPQIETTPLKKTPELFQFNPNMVKREELIKLGIAPSVAATFIKYRNTGAKFYKKVDIKKVYGIKETDYKRLEPYINIPQKKAPIVPKEKPNIEKPKTLTPFNFDPNLISKEEFLQLGLAPKVVQTILNYRSKGGKFYKKQDFKKIYGLSEKDYEVLAPYINISKTSPVYPKEKNISNVIPQEFEETDFVKIDINNSTKEDWKKLKGIGEMTAKRIVNFRDKLGGFTSIEHIKQTWNVPDSVIDKVAQQLIATPITNKIAINAISAEDLKLHPYIKRKQAYTIVNYRTNHGNYDSLEDLKKVGALQQDFINRIAPYLSFD